MITPFSTRFKPRYGYTTTRTLLELLTMTPSEELRTFKMSAWLLAEQQDISRERGARRREANDAR